MKLQIPVIKLQISLIIINSDICTWVTINYRYLYIAYNCCRYL